MTESEERHVTGEIVDQHHTPSGQGCAIKLSARTSTLA